MPGSYLVSKKRFIGLKSLCYSCANSVAHLCHFMSLEDPNEGLLAMGARAAHVKGEDAFKVTKCPGYIKGPPPPLERRPDL